MHPFSNEFLFQFSLKAFSPLFFGFLFSCIFLSSVFVSSSSLSSSLYILPSLWYRLECGKYWNTDIRHKSQSLCHFFHFHFYFSLYLFHQFRFISILRIGRGKKQTVFLEWTNEEGIIYCIGFHHFFSLLRLYANILNDYMQVFCNIHLLRFRAFWSNSNAFQKIWKNWNLSQNVKFPSVAFKLILNKKTEYTY